MLAIPCAHKELQAVKAGMFLWQPLENDFYIWNKASTSICRTVTGAPSRRSSSATCIMPRTQASKTRAQRAFAPLIVRARFRPESVILSTSLTLPWRKTFPPHVEGIPATDATPTSHSGSANGRPPTTKMKCPNGECSRNPSTGRGYQLKETLKLPDDLYEEILVSPSASPYPLFNDTFRHLFTNTQLETST